MSWHILLQVATTAEGPSKTINSFCQFVLHHVISPQVLIWESHQERSKPGMIKAVLEICCYALGDLDFSNDPSDSMWLCVFLQT